MNIKLPGQASFPLTVTLSPTNEAVEMKVPEKKEVCHSQCQRPEGVKDIEGSEDQGNPQLCAEYAADIYSYLRHLEDGLPIREDFLQGSVVSSVVHSHWSRSVEAG